MTINMIAKKYGLSVFKQSWLLLLKLTWKKQTNVLM